MTHKRNIVLIGMPGVGKSTVGVILAKELGYQFIDTDLLIQQREGCRLKDIIEAKGIDGFLTIENEVIASLQADHCVIATGGSAVYNKEAMEHLSRIGTILYLKLPYKNLEQRLKNLQNRGVVLRPQQKLKDIFTERTALYEAYADYTIDETNMDIEATLQTIIDVLLESQNFLTTS